LGGQVDLSIISAVVAGPLVNSGKMKSYAIIGRKRFAGLPDLPTLVELGYNKLAIDFWHMLLAPAGTPRPIVDKLNAAINKAIASQTFKDRFAMIGDEPAGGTPEEFAELIRTDSAKWGEVVRRSGARLD